MGFTGTANRKCAILARTFEVEHIDCGVHRYGESHSMCSCARTFEAGSLLGSDIGGETTWYSAMFQPS